MVVQKDHRMIVEGVLAEIIDLNPHAELTMPNLLKKVSFNKVRPALPHNYVLVPLSPHASPPRHAPTSCGVG